MSFFDSIKNLPNAQENIYDDIKSHSLPVIIYGAGIMAKKITSRLSENGIEVYGYAVDEQYFEEDKKFLNKPILSFDLLKNESEKYVFVLGLMGNGNCEAARKFIENNEIIKYVILAFDGELGPITYDFLKSNLNKFSETYNWLCDDFSRETFCEFLNLKISGDPRYNLKITCDDQYFNELTEKFKSGVLVDCGAYTGDTIKDFIKWNAGVYEKIYAIEADEENRKKMLDSIKKNNYHDVDIINCGVWNKKGKLSFKKVNDSSSCIDESSYESIVVDSVDNICANYRGGVFR